MPPPIHPEIEKLAAVARVLPTLTTIDAMMQYDPCFRAACQALDAETDPQRKQRAVDYIERLAPRSGGGRVLFLSFLVSATQDAKQLWNLYRTVSKEEFTPVQRHFFYWQLVGRHAKIQGPPAVEPHMVYAALLKTYRKMLRVNSPWIDLSNRDPDRIVVITNQLLSPYHAPTADCLDYCHVLQRRLKKRVFLINTGDMPWMLQLPYYDPLMFNYAPEYSTLSRLEFRGETFDFYQCRLPMPDLREIEFVIGKVLEIKPGFVLSLGHSNVTPDLCSEFLTVSTMPFGTDLPRAASNLFILPRERRPQDAGFMSRWNIRDEQIVETRYTFRLPDRSASLTRAQLGLPEDAYVIAIVGNRLDQEITVPFAAELAGLLHALPRAFIAFMGMFQSYDRLAQSHEVFGKQSLFLGHQKDIVAAYECCDAYLNPPRYGGGSSAALALAAGLPVFTLDHGDVANIVGDRFFSPTLREVKAFIEQALADSQRRRELAQLAKDCFATISDREGMLRHIVQQSMEKAHIRY